MKDVINLLETYTNKLLNKKIEVKICQNKKNMGKGGALRSGFKFHGKSLSLPITLLFDKATT